MAKIDAMEVFGSTISGYLKRMLIFLSSGWVGFLIGSISMRFTDISDFSDPRLFTWMLNTPLEWFAVFLWPVTQLWLVTSTPALVVISILLTTGMFIAYVHLDGGPILWWCGIVMTSSLMLVFGAHGFDRLFPYGMLFALWTGVIAGTFHFYRRANPDAVARAAAFLSGRKDEYDDGYESIADIKARLDEEDDDEET